MGGPDSAGPVVARPVEPGRPRHEKGGVKTMQNRILFERGVSAIRVWLRTKARGRHDGQRPSAVGGGMNVRSSAGCSVRRP